MSKYLLLISFALSGCLSIEGDKVAYIYPKEGIANIRQFSNSCPVKVTKAITVNINNLNGWISCMFSSIICIRVHNKSIAFLISNLSIELI